MCMRMRVGGVGLVSLILRDVPASGGDRGPDEGGEQCGQRTAVGVGDGLGNVAGSGAQGGGGLRRPCPAFGGVRDSGSDPVLQPLLAGLLPIRLHDLRHGAAMLMLTPIIDVKIVPDTLGHSDTRITRDIYQNPQELHQTGEKLQVVRSGQGLTRTSSCYNLAS